MARKRRLSGTAIPKPMEHNDLRLQPVFDSARAVRDLTAALQKLSVSDGDQPKSTSNQANRTQQDASNKKPTLLLLPRELRDLIYEYTFTQRVELVESPQNVTERGAGLLATCRQTYREARPLYYEHATFFSADLDLAVHWAAFSMPWICEWLRNVCWEHDAREMGASKNRCFEFFSEKDRASVYFPEKYGKEVLKTFYYTPEDELVWCCSKDDLTDEDYWAFG